MPPLPTPGLILRESMPANLESPFSSLDGEITPPELFYVRNHFPAPALDRQSWRLHIEGAVNRRLTLSYQDLERMPNATLPALLECAGNNRAFLTPKQEGVQWALGAVGCAEWTGVPLAAVLDQAGVDPNAIEVVFEGADHGHPEKKIKPEQPIHFTRAIPLDKARRPEVLLAYAMNGVSLPDDHGAPVRAIVPGWYAMASVKWLTRILVRRRPFQGYFQTVEYAYWTGGENQPAERIPVSELSLKAQIARPAPREVIPGGSSYRVHGTAWSAHADLARVEVTTDGGLTWADAQLLESSGEYAWRLWEYVWQVPKTKGRRTLIARAIDMRGGTQPVKHDPNFEGYAVHHLLPIRIQLG